MTSPRYTLKAADPFSSHTRVARILDAALSGRPEPRILDVGCAGGMVKRTAELRGLAVAGRARWIGLDADPAALEAAAAAGMEVHTTDLEAERPPVAGPFDAVVFADVLEHLPSPAALLARWLPALCAPGTLIVVSLPNVAHLSVRIGLCLGRFEYAERGILDRGHLRFFTRRSARRMLESAGLRVARAWVTPVPVYLVWQGLGARPLGAVQAGVFALTRLAPTLLGYQFVFEAYRADDGR